MILITGGTGFIGKALVRHLVEAGYQVRTLIRPSATSPNLPKGVPVEVAVSSLTDERGIRAAMVGVDTVYHLASSERRGAKEANLWEIDVRGTQVLTQAALDAGVDRMFYVSHLGADRASAYPVLKAKAIAEEHIRRSGINYTILRSALVFGPGDGFTTGLARIMRSLPFFFLMPGDGKVLLQPLWVEDLVTCLAWSLDYEHTRNQTYDIGGPEYLSFQIILENIMEAAGVRRSLVQVRPPYMRYLTIFLEHNLHSLPVSVFWLDYLAANHTCQLNTLPHTFNLLPARFSQRLAYLKGKNWKHSFTKSLLERAKPEK
jgi:uncharacterized protein YbjT (DUF2867 family)